MTWIIAIALSGTLNLLLVMWGRGGFYAMSLPGLASLWVGLPLLIVAPVAYSVGRCGSLRILRGIGVWALALSLVTFSTLLSVPVGARVCEIEVRKAQAFCESLVTTLEQDRLRAGEYPPGIVGALAGRVPPRLLTPTFYWSDGTNYTFTIRHPGVFMGGIRYSSLTTHWSEWD